MAGFIPLVEIWIHDHFRLGGVPNLGYKIGEPTFNKWEPQQHVGEDKKATVIKYREALDELSPEQVIWYPLKDAYPMQQITWYSGCLIFFDTIEAYHPERVVRQMGKVQGIRKEPITSMTSRRSKTGKNYKIEYSILPHYLEDWTSHLLSSVQQGVRAMHPYDCEPDYVDWFLKISHPCVQKPENRVTGPLQNTTTHVNKMRQCIIRTLELLDESFDAGEDQEVETYALREKKIYEVLQWMEKRSKQKNDCNS